MKPRVTERPNHPGTFKIVVDYATLLSVFTSRPHGCDGEEFWDAILAAMRPRLGMK